MEINVRAMEINIRAMEINIRAMGIDTRTIKTGHRRCPRVSVCLTFKVQTFEYRQFS